MKNRFGETIDYGAVMTYRLNNVSLAGSAVTHG